jgi:putative ABC transport system substrate-binding protein
MNNRRRLIIALGAGALAAPFGSFAQQPGKVWRVGFLAVRSRSTPSDPEFTFDAFVHGLRGLGYVEGKNLLLDWRSAEGQNERLPALAVELVQAKSDVLVATGTNATLAALKATSLIPIVMIGVADPVGNGLVKSLARPGGNATGVSNLIGETSSKVLEFLLAMVPKLRRVAVLANPTNDSHVVVLKQVEAAMQKRGVKYLPVQARNAQEIESAFAAMTRQNAKAVIVPLDPHFQVQKNQIVELAAKHRLPSIAMYSEYVEGGGLMSYGPNRPEYFRRAAVYVDKILKGAKPADLPVEQATTFELFINRKTARALGLTIPQSLLISADKVIE